jgi:hypothetical protein
MSLTPIRLGIVLAVYIMSLSMVIDSALASSTPAQYCNAQRGAAAGKFAQCILKQLGLFDCGDFVPSQLKCIAKYSQTWAKLQAKASGSGSPCDSPRFSDNGDGTVTDHLTGLQWERKDNLDSTPNLSDPHDADNTYTLSAGVAASDGTAFTDLLATLNGGSCFAGQCDWRVPTVSELLTIYSAPTTGACQAPPCIADPLLAPTSDGYWAATDSFQTPGEACIVEFINGGTGAGVRANPAFVRAVRGGLPD